MRIEENDVRTCMTTVIVFENKKSSDRVEAKLQFMSKLNELSKIAETMGIWLDFNESIGFYEENI